MFRIGKSFSGAALALIFSLIGGLVFAQGPPPPGDFLPGLGQDQKTRLRAVMDEARRDTDKLYDQLRQTRSQLGQYFDSYTLDEKAIWGTIHKINSIQNGIMKQHFQTQKEIRRVLTPAQFDQFTQAMKAMRQKGHGPRGPRGGRPPD